MAWQSRTTCQQCSKRLSARDQQLGTICTSCVKGNRTRIYDQNGDAADQHTDDNNN